MPPLVSVVSIFLNAEKFIQEAIVSVLARTYEQSRDQIEYPSILAHESGAREVTP